MDRFKNILVAVTPGRLDPVSMRSIGQFAQANEARLTMIDVVEPMPAWRRSVNVEGRVIDVQGLLLDQRRDEIHRFAEIAGGAVTDVVVTTGKPFVEVIRHAMESGCDLVVAGEPAPTKHGTPGLSAGVMQLVRKCPIPVWVVRSVKEPRRVVLALVDPDPADPVRDSLNGLVLDLAVSMSRRGAGELHVAHAWHIVGDSAMTSSPFLSVPSGEYELIRGAVEADRRTALNELAQRHGVAGVGGQVHLVAGYPDEVLPGLARRLGVGLIVMGTVARTGLSGLIMGNTAEAILRSVDCSVLALKPEGFETPVRMVGRVESNA